MATIMLERRHPLAGGIFCAGVELRSSVATASQDSFPYHE